MTSTSLISERIFEARGTGKDPAELTVFSGFTGLTATAAEINVLAGVTAGTNAASKGLVLDANRGIGTTWRDTRTVPLGVQAAAGTLNASGTLTAALILGGIVTSTTGAAVTATLDTGTNLETALIALQPGLQNSDYFELTVINTGGANAFTVATAGGWTDGGNAFTAVAAASSAKFGIRRTSANNYTIFKVA